MNAADGRDQLTALVDLMRRLQRGPRREGVFALWLLAKVAWDVANGDAETAKANRKRVGLLERRLAPLAVPRPLARGMATSILHLSDGSPEGARLALAQLVAPARDAIGTEAAEPLSQLVRCLRGPRQSAVSDPNRP